MLIFEKQLRGLVLCISHDLSIATDIPTHCRHELLNSAASTCWSPKRDTVSMTITYYQETRTHPEMYGQNNICKKMRLQTILLSLSCSLRGN